MLRLGLNLILPLATRWVHEQEQRIVSEGILLAPNEAFLAHLAGVRNPEKVRLMHVDFIPMPEDTVLRKANELVNLVSPVTAGITFGYGIYIRDDIWGDRKLLAHELVHVAQYERFGSVGAFLKEYLDECLSIGYPNGPLEQEAITKSAEICSI